MHNFFRKLVGTGVVCGMLVFAAPLTSMAAIGPGFAAGTYVATVTAESVNINKNRDSEEVLFTAKAGSTYEVLEDCGDGWMKVRVHDTEGYLPVSENAVVEEAEEGEIAMIQKEARESSASYKRQQLADYALQFVGGPYQYGGSDPHTGVDCSGFTRYVYQHGAGITLNRSSRGQALSLREHKSRVIFPVKGDNTGAHRHYDFQLELQKSGKDQKYYGVDYGGNPRTVRIPCKGLG